MPARTSHCTAEKRLLNPQEAADYLGVTRRWISRAVAERRLRFVKLGPSPQARLRFQLSDLEAFVSENTHEEIR